MFDIDEFIDACESYKIIDFYVDCPSDLVYAAEGVGGLAIKAVSANFEFGKAIKSFFEWVGKVVDGIRNWWNSMKEKFKSKKTLRLERDEYIKLYNRAKREIKILEEKGTIENQALKEELDEKDDIIKQQKSQINKLGKGTEKLRQQLNTMDTLLEKSKKNIDVADKLKTQIMSNLSHIVQDYQSTYDKIENVTSRILDDTSRYSPKMIKHQYLQYIRPLKDDAGEIEAAFQKLTQMSSSLKIDMKSFNNANTDDTIRSQLSACGAALSLIRNAPVIINQGDTETLAQSDKIISIITDHMNKAKKFVISMKNEKETENGQIIINAYRSYIKRGQDIIVIINKLIQ